MPLLRPFSYNFKHRFGISIPFVLYPVLLLAHVVGHKSLEPSRIERSLDLREEPNVEEATVLKSIRALSVLRFQLDKALTEGRRSPEIKMLTDEYFKKEKILVQHLEEGQLMTRATLFEKMKQEIQRIQQMDQKTTKKREDQKKEQEKQIKAFTTNGTRAIFHSIKPGSFEMGEEGKKVKVTLTKPFGMMATLTTQIIWRQVAELAEKNFPGKYEIDVNPSYFQGDTRPVEQVSFQDIHIWISALNNLSKKGESALFDLIPGHKKGDVYRLPTEAEWEFVIRGRGQYNEAYHFGNNPSELGIYGWYKENSNKQTHPVAEKQPLIIDGNDFYDMHGNVAELVQDRYQENLKGGKDPRGPWLGSHRVERGGSWDSDERYLRSARRDTWEPFCRNSDVGFRLVKDY